jgi:Transposase domain (DUF772)
VYPKAGQGRPPVGVERILRIYFLHQWFNVSDPAVEEALMIRRRCEDLWTSIWGESRCRKSGKYSGALYGEHGVADTDPRRRMEPIEFARPARMLRQAGEHCQLKYRRGGFRYRETDWYLARPEAYFAAEGGKVSDRQRSNRTGRQLSIRVIEARDRD